MNTPLFISISSRRLFESPLKHYLGNEELVAHLYFENKRRQKKEGCREEKERLAAKKSKMRLTTNLMQMHAPRIKINTKRRRKTAEKGGGNGKKAEREAKNVMK